jgi:hypothetical protein
MRGSGLEIARSIISIAGVLFIVGFICFAVYSCSASHKIYLRNYTYCGDTDGGILHRTDCEELEGLEEYLIGFDSYTEGREADFVPCSECLYTARKEYELAEDAYIKLEEHPSDNIALQEEYDKLKGDYDFYVEEAQYLDDMFTIAADLQGKDYSDLMLECLKSGHPLAEKYQ